MIFFSQEIAKIKFQFACSDSDVPLYSFSKLLNSLSGISDLLSEFRLSNTNGEFIRSADGIFFSN